jgi:riboflavin-specific deaminase-like protein
LVRELGQRAKAGRPLLERAAFPPSSVAFEQASRDSGVLWVSPDAESPFEGDVPLSSDTRCMLELLLPLCTGASATDLVLAHIGQSLDGQIATSSGASRYVTGRKNLVHIHRLRALFDAVVVGARTVECDDPQLTTRLVEGESPARVIIDAELSVPLARKVFDDASAPTLVVCARGKSARERFGSSAEVVELPLRDGRLSPSEVVAALRERGLRRLFIEGGGITVSRFLQAGALHRLHVTISPILVGAGRPGILLPPIDALDHALRPKTRRFELGEDVLFDCCFDAGERRWLGNELDAK